MRAPILCGVATGLLLVLGLIAPFASAVASGQSITGTMKFRSATLVGNASLASSSLEAFLLRALDERVLEVDFEVRAMSGSVNWTRMITQGVGQAPNDPNASLLAVDTRDYDSGQEPFSNATLQVTAHRRDGAMLMEALGASSMTVAAVAGAEVRPSLAETWVVGKGADGVSAGRGRPADMRRAHNVTPALVEWRTVESLEARLNGDLSVHLWNVEVRIEEDDGSVSEYRSGAWTEEETQDPVTGGRAARTDAHQVLTLQLYGAIGVLETSGGEARAVAGQAATQLTGALSVEDVTAYLEAGDHFYSLDHGDVTLEGRMALDWGRGDSEHVFGSVQGEASAISVPPTGRLQIPAAAAALPRGVAVGAVIAVVLAASVVAFGAIRRRSPQRPLITMAEEALVQRKPRRARRFASRILRSDPNDEDALFVRGASLIQQGRYDAVVRDLSPPAKRDVIGRHGLAFLLAYAHAKLGNDGKALRWVRVAQEDPLLVRKIEEDAAFEPLRKKPGYRRLARSRVRDAAYA